MNRNFLRSQLSEKYLLVEAKPHSFYELVDVINSLDENFADEVDEIVAQMSAVSDVLEDEAQRLRQSFNALLEGVRQAIKRHNPFDELMVDNDPLEDFEHTNGNNFVRVVLSVITDLQAAHYFLHDTAKNMHAEHIELFSRKLVASNFEDLQAFTIQYQMHAPTVSAFANSILAAEDCLTTVIATGFQISNKLEGYYKALNHRHSSEGIEIHVDPITTDLAMSIYENVDSHGEIQDGKKPDEISIYTIRKAELLTEAIKTGILGTFARDPSKFIQFIEDEMTKLWESGKNLSAYAKLHADKIRKITKFKGRTSKIDKGRFEQAMIFIRDLNPSGITYKEKTGLLTVEERHDLEFKNDTIRSIAHLISTDANTADLLRYILVRKQTLREYHLEENSFFVCKIGSGNAFTGDAPGELKVVPGIKPSVNLSEVVGSGFQEVVDFMKHILDGAKWFDVFLATSPSRKADKSNVLLVGPQGCHRKGQKILKFDGDMVSVEDIKCGDLLMGDDNTPRMVKSLHHGTESMVEIIPTKGEPWVVNKGHILSLVRMGHNKTSGEIRDVSVADYISWSSYMRSEFKLFRVGVNFTSQILPLDPYFLGALLGDGSLGACPGLTTGDDELVQEVYSQASKFNLHINPSPDPTSSVTRYYLSGIQHHTNPIMSILRDLGLGGTSTESKFVPNIYKISSRSDRLEILAGLIDTDGSLTDGCYDFQSKSKLLANDVTFIARSLGLAAYIRPFDREDSNGISRDYYRVKISGNIQQIPVRIARKKAEIRKQIKDVLRIGFELRELPPEEYFGFTVDGNHRYLLDDFTVTHNCGKTEVLRAVASDRKAVGVFVQASDFLTCWKGEQEKNPKRLFEAGLKIQKESRKQVFFLIDEIDTILNDSQGQNAFGGTNLATEFQVLMDGITTYPNLALWGATNHPERIPMPLIRRFSKVIIVGELTQADRVALLKQFLAFLPCSPEMTDEILDGAAQALKGAVGDIMRKVVDNVWREKMSYFVSKHPEAAEQVLKLLNSDGQKFNPSTFSPEKRQEMFKIISPFVQVTPEDLLRSIEKHITNIAIQNEIRTAVSVYDNARQFLAALDR